MNTYADIEVARQPPVCELCVTRMSDEAGISRAEARRRLATPTDRGQRRRNLRRGDSMTTQPQTERTSLAAWLLEQIAEDERVAPKVMLAVTFVADDGYLSAGFDLMEARVLADCEAKRALLALHPTNVTGSYLGRQFTPLDEHCDCQEKRVGDDVWWEESEPCLTKRLLAQPFADRPGFDPEWGIE